MMIVIIFAHTDDNDDDGSMAARGIPKRLRCFLFLVLFESIRASVRVKLVGGEGGGVKS